MPKVNILTALNEETKLECFLFNEIVLNSFNVVCDAVCFVLIISVLMLIYFIVY